MSKRYQVENWNRAPFLKIAHLTKNCRFRAMNIRKVLDFSRKSSKKWDEFKARPLVTPLLI